MAFSEAAGAQDHGEGENYFVSMTDMMVGMLFIFIILLMSFAFLFRQQTDVSQATEIRKAAHVEDIKRELEGLKKAISQEISKIHQAAKLREQLLGELYTEFSRDKLTVEVDILNGVLHLSDKTIRFSPDDATLIGPTKENVDKIAGILLRVLPAYAPCLPARPVNVCQNNTNAAIETVFIEGHTDETGNNDDRNWTLSAQRASNTYREIIIKSPKLGEIHNRKDQKILSISGYSSDRPVDGAHNSSAWEKNRRIDLRFVMDTDGAAGLEQMQRLLERMGERIEELKESP